MMSVGRLLGMVVAAGTLAMAAPVRALAQGQGPSTGGLVALEQERRMLGQHRRVLMIAAHPDDENTEILTILARGQGAETAYLSLTRGEGGQNLIGPELGPGLGLVRSGELLAARQIDGGRQFFTRAMDYGFSKTLEEAWRFWPRDSILKDAVRVVRRFRPQILITVFTGTPLDGHGQHQAAGWIAEALFEAAGDPERFPELAREEGLAPHQPLKLYRASRFDPGAPMAELDGGSLDPVVGQSYRQVAMRSRSLHRSQDQGVVQEMGPSTARLQLLRDRTGGGADLWAGIDTRPVAGDPDQRRRADRVRAIEAGVMADARVDDARVVPGQSLTAVLALWNTGGAPLRARADLDGPGGSWPVTASCLGTEVTIAAGTVHECRVTVTVPPAWSWSVPYFLHHPPAGGLYRWDGHGALRGEPFDPPPLSARFTVRPDAGDPFVVEVPATQRQRDQAFGELRRPLQVVPRIGVVLDQEAVVWGTGGGTRAVGLTLQHGARDTTRGRVELELPAGWPASPPHPFVLDREDQRTRISVPVTIPTGAAAGRYGIRAVAITEAGDRYGAGYQIVDYPHIAPRLLPRPATLAVAVAPVALPEVGVVGYVRGAADRVPEALREAGVPVEVLDRAALQAGDLTRFQVIVIGSRAYEVDTVLVEQHPRLMDWVRAGGRLVVQYQQQTYFGGGFAPAPMALAPRGHDRVTDESAAVRVLRPASPIVTTPNRIGAADWEGWVQERGLYFPRSWDPRWTTFLAMSDPAESPLEGALLATRVGRGTYLYTGLSFFRQLPAAVPGALRLFLNILAYSHPDAAS